VLQLPGEKENHCPKCNVSLTFAEYLDSLVERSSGTTNSRIVKSGSF